MMMCAEKQAIDEVEGVLEKEIQALDQKFDKITVEFKET